MYVRFVGGAALFVIRSNFLRGKVDLTHLRKENDVLVFSCRC